MLAVLEEWTFILYWVGATGGLKRGVKLECRSHLEAQDTAS